MDAAPPRPPRSLLIAIFLLPTLEFLQSGMVAFAAAPIMGDVSASPENFSTANAAYTTMAVAAIAKLRWLVERLGWRLYLQLAVSVFVAGCMICASSTSFPVFLLGRCVMGIGGGAFMTSGRVMVHLTAGPSRFLGIRYFATGLAVGIAASPALAATTSLRFQGTSVFLVLAVVALMAAVAGSVSLPDSREEAPERSLLPLHAYVALIGGSFLVLHALQRVQYDLFGLSAPLWASGAVGALALWHFWRSLMRSKRPLLEVRALGDAHYIAGVGLFTLCYITLGANNAMLPIFMQRALGFAWESIGQLQTFGLSAAIVSWLAMAWLLPRRPEPRKYFVAGFLALAYFGWHLAGLSNGVNPWRDVLPALACNGVFLIFVLASTAIQTFRNIQSSERILSHGQQLKNMIAQLGMGAGMAVAAAELQARTAVHYTALHDRIADGDPAFVEISRLVSEGASNSLAASSAAGSAMGEVAQQLNQQAALLACTDYFVVVTAVGLIGAAIMAKQRLMR